MATQRPSARLWMVAPRRFLPNLSTLGCFAAKSTRGLNEPLEAEKPSRSAFDIAFGGRAVLQCKCLLMTQSGHFGHLAPIPLDLHRICHGRGPPEGGIMKRRG